MRLQNKRKIQELFWFYFIFNSYYFVDNNLTMKGKYCSVIVICSTFNGQKYLKNRQITIFSKLYIAKDYGSTDGTKEIQSSYNIELLDSSKNLGVKRSFETLIKYACDYSDVEYFIFCDQVDA